MIARRTRRYWVALAIPGLALVLAGAGLRSTANQHAPQRASPLPAVSIFIVAGQSNAIGFGTNAAHLPPEYNTPLPVVRHWYELGSDASIDDPLLRRTSGDQFEELAPLADPTGEMFGGAAAGFGPEIGLGHALAASVDTEVAILKFGFGATDLTHHWNPQTPGGLYQQLLAEVAAVRARLASQQRVSSVRGFFWVHGENDATDFIMALEYGSNLQAFVRSLRVDLSEPRLPVVVSRLNVFLPTAPGANFDYVDVVRFGQLQAVNALGSARLVDTDDLELAPHPMHFASLGQLDLGQRMAQAWHSVTDPVPEFPQ
ncbi:MAG: sialate O-acetylesterase [Planctomycetota bacterium]